MVLKVRAYHPEAPNLRPLRRVRTRDVAGDVVLHDRAVQAVRNQGQARQARCAAVINPSWRRRNVADALAGSGSSNS